MITLTNSVTLIFPIVCYYVIYGLPNELHACFVSCAEMVLILILSLEECLSGNLSTLCVLVKKKSFFRTHHQVLVYSVLVFDVHIFIHAIHDSQVAGPIAQSKARPIDYREVAGSIFRSANILSLKLIIKFSLPPVEEWKLSATCEGMSTEYWLIGLIVGLG